MYVNFCEGKKPILRDGEEEGDEREEEGRGRSEEREGRRWVGGMEGDWWRRRGMRVEGKVEEGGWDWRERIKKGGEKGRGMEEEWLVERR